MRCLPHRLTLTSSPCLTFPLKNGFLSASAGVAQRRYQSRLPNRGYREQPLVPDRLKDAMSQFGVNVNNVTFEQEDPPFIPEEQRHKLVQETLTSTQNLRNHAKLDRLRAALDSAHSEPPDSDVWREVYLFLRTTELCCELMPVAADKFPKGQKLWIELDLCEEKRVPALLELPNGMIVLPVFSMEEYMDFYFSRTEVFESCWFPVPRMGTRWEAFCQLPFPVGATGILQHFSTLATIALGGAQVGILVNPGQRTSKFITYPEMVQLAKIKQQRSSERTMELKRVGPDGVTPEYLFDPHLLSGFDTRKMEMRRVEPAQLADKLRRRPKIPQVAQLELHLLLYPYDEIAQVYIRTVDRPRWRKMLGASEKMTRIDVVSHPGTKPPPAFFDHLKRWSFMQELQSDVHVELTNKIPSQTEGDLFMCVYTAEDGDMLRRYSSFKGITLAESLGYRDPIVDSKGNKPYEKLSGFM